MSVRRVYCGKMTEGIWMPLGWWVGWWSRDGCITWGWWSSKRKGQFGGELGASHANQWHVVV